MVRTFLPTPSNLKIFIRTGQFVWKIMIYCLFANRCLNIKYSRVSHTVKKGELTQIIGENIGNRRQIEEIYTVFQVF